MEYVLYWTAMGLIAPVVARGALPHAGGNNKLGELVVGIIGALTAGWIFLALRGHGSNGWAGSTAVAFAGAGILLCALRLVSGRRPAAQ